jgi:outer membrane autotransporter protein
VTWYGDNGFYVDGQAQTTKYVSNLNSSLAGTMTNDNNGLGYAFAIESGKRIDIGNGWSITPQDQLTYSAVDFSAFADRFGASVSLDNADSLLARAGIAVNHRQAWRDGEGQLTSADVYGIVNLHYEFLDGTNVNVSGTNFASANDRLWGSIGGGGTYSWDAGKYSLYGEVSYNTSLSNVGESDSYRGIGGFRVVW